MSVSATVDFSPFVSNDAHFSSLKRVALLFKCRREGEEEMKIGRVQFISGCHRANEVLRHHLSSNQTKRLEDKQGKQDYVPWLDTVTSDNGISIRAQI